MKRESQKTKNRLMLDCNNHVLHKAIPLKMETESRNL